MQFRKSQLEEMDKARSKVGGWGAGLHSFSDFHVLFLWNLGQSPILHIDVFTKQEPSLSLDSQSFFYWDFIMWELSRWPHD